MEDSKALLERQSLATMHITDMQSAEKAGKYITDINDVLNRSLSRDNRRKAESLKDMVVGIARQEIHTILACSVENMNNHVKNGVTLSEYIFSMHACFLPVVFNTGWINVSECTEEWKRKVVPRFNLACTNFSVIFIIERDKVTTSITISY